MWIEWSEFVENTVGCVYVTRCICVCFNNTMSPFPGSMLQNSRNSPSMCILCHCIVFSAFIMLMVFPTTGAIHIIPYIHRISCIIYPYCVLMCGVHYSTLYMNHSIFESLSPIPPHRSRSRSLLLLPTQSHHSTQSSHPLYTSIIYAQKYYST